QLQRNALRHQLRVEFRLVHFENVDKDLAVRALLQVRLQLLNLRALAPDDDARTRRTDDDPQLVAGTLDLNRADARGLQLVFQLAPQQHVLNQQAIVSTIDKPPRLPRLIDSQP